MCKILHSHRRTLTACWVLLALLGLSAVAGAADCGRSMLPESLRREWTLTGSGSLRVDLQSGARNLLLRVDERGIDVGAELLDSNGTVIERSDSPVEREGAQWLHVPESGAATLLIEGKGPGSLRGTVRLRAISSGSPTAQVAACGLVGPRREAREQSVGGLGPTAVGKQSAGGLGGTHPAVGTQAAANPVAEEQAATDQAAAEQAAGDQAYALGLAMETAQIPSTAGTARAAYESAARAYRGALGRLSDEAPPGRRGELELALAALSYYKLQDWKAAASWAERSAGTFNAGADTYRRARAQAILAAAWMELATRSSTAGFAASAPGAARQELSNARSLLAQLAALHARRRELYDEALQINNIGVAYIYEARFEAALPYLSRAQAAFSNVGDTSRVAIALQNIALCEWGLGRLSSSIDTFDRALKLIAPTPHPQLYLTTLNNSGLAHFAAGRLDEALRLESTALDLATQTHVERARARSFYGLGVTYYAIGDRDLARDFLRRALAICPADLDARNRVATLRALGEVEYETGDHEQAIAHDSEALRLATAPSARARILLRLAQDYASRNDTARAVQILNGVIDSPPNGDGLLRGMALIQRGSLLQDSAADAAQQDIERGLAALARFDAVPERFAGRLALAHVLASHGHIGEALTTVRLALTASREIRAMTANPEYQSSLSESIRPALALEVDLLHEEYARLLLHGHQEAAARLAAESLEAVDEFRASAFEALRAENFDGRDPTRLAQLLAASTSLDRDIAERRSELNAREDVAGADDSRARGLREDIGRLRVRIGLIDAEIARRSTVLHDGQFGVSSFDATSRLHAAVPGRTLVEYWLGPEHAYAWVVGEHRVSWIPLAGSDSIEAAARRLHAAMRSQSDVSVAERVDAGKELYRLVILPLLDTMGTPASLVIVPDRSLHYVPFAALADDRQRTAHYLIQSAELSIAPALRFVPASSANRSDSRPQPARMLLVADPIYSSDDARLGGAHSQLVAANATDGRSVLRGGVTPSALPRLYASAREAEQIRRLFGTDRVDYLSGVEATRANVLAKDLPSYRFIHIASHGLIDAQIPRLSALILGAYGKRGIEPDPFLRAGDFLAHTFRAQAIVLSACDTALGKESASEGLVGLRYAALARGSHSVVASLWPVSDEISAELMTGMYQELAGGAPGSQAGRVGRNGSTVAGPASEVSTALAHAMRHALDKVPGLDPALWAAFTVYVAGD